MSNPNSPINKLKEFLKNRWSASDHPSTKKRLQITLIIKDLCIFVFAPFLLSLLFNSCSRDKVPAKSSKTNRKRASLDNSHQQLSQIISFTKATAKHKFANYSKRAPGTLVKVRLLNSLSVSDNTPVHAMVIDNSLGKNLYGSKLIGEAQVNAASSSIAMTFNLLKPRNTNSIAIPLAARALSLNGSFGVAAKKQEGFFSRAALGSSNKLIENAEAESNNIKDLLLRALAAGALGEASIKSNNASRQSQMLRVSHNKVFYAELVDYFPKGTHE